MQNSNTEVQPTQIQMRETADGAIWLTIDRAPKHNALARQVLLDLADKVRQVGQLPHVRYIVITGAGDKYFAAGGDLRELSNVREEQAVKDMMTDAFGSLNAIRECPVPVIALLNGDAIGGGAELAVACEMRLMTSHARIGFIQAKLAITSAWGGGPDLFKLVGSSRAMRMMTRYELVDASTALTWGLADAMISDGPDGSDLSAFLKPLNHCSTLVLRGIKAQSISARSNASWSEHRHIELQHLVRTWLHDDHWVAAENLLKKSSS
jgi:enoyl-CoA hydratase/carnithine racemase